MAIFEIRKIVEQPGANTIIICL